MIALSRAEDTVAADRSIKTPMHFEVEQKFHIAEISAVEQRLRGLSACESGSVEQVDRYFNHPARDFAQTDEALRLRQVGKANFITYKGPKLDATTKTRREIELPLAPGKDQLDSYAVLLTALGFRFVAEVRKTRRLLHVEWQQQTIEVALDDVSGLGQFVELELSADESQMAAAKAAINSLAAKLGLEHSERKSYLELLLNKQPSASAPG